MKKEISFLITSMMMVIVTSAQAGQLRLGTPSYGGTGCPAGSASVNLSPDDSALSILFDSYTVEAQGSKRVDRKSCNISVPVQVPQGYSLAVFQVDYRGFVSVPRGGMNRFEAEYFWAGSRGPRFTKQFSGPITDSFTLTNDLIAETVVWTPCGASVNLRANTSMMAQTNSRGEQSIGSVDSADVTSGLIYHIQWRRCN